MGQALEPGMGGIPVPHSIDKACQRQSLCASQSTVSTKRRLSCLPPFAALLAWQQWRNSFLLRVCQQILHAQTYPILLTLPSFYNFLLVGAQCGNSAIIR
jgi:hypothetical protein